MSAIIHLELRPNLLLRGETFPHNFGVEIGVKRQLGGSPGCDTWTWQNWSHAAPSLVTPSRNVAEP
jgi:hypothetical protein